MSRSNASHRHPHTNNFKTITNIEKRVLSNEINETINPNTDNAHDLGVGGLTWRSANIRKVRLMGNDDVTDQYDETGTLFIAGGLAATDTIACTTILADNLESITGLTFTYPLSRAPGPPNPILSLLYDGTTLQLNGTNQLKVSVDGTTLKYITSALGFNLDNRTLKYNAGITKVEVDAIEVIKDISIIEPLEFSSFNQLILKYDNDTLQLENIIPGDPSSGQELAVAIDKETLEMSAPGGVLRVNLDNDTIKYDEDLNVHVDHVEVFRNVDFLEPLSYSRIDNEVALDVDDITIISEEHATGKYHLTIGCGEKGSIIKTASGLEANIDGISLGNQTGGSEWIYVKDVGLSLAGIKKWSWLFYLDLLGISYELLTPDALEAATDGFLDAIISSLATLETLAGETILPASLNVEQKKHYLKNTKWMQVKCDQESIQFQTSVPTFLARQVLGALYCPGIKASLHGGNSSGRIPYFGTNINYSNGTLTSDSTFKYDSPKLIVRQISPTDMSRSTTNDSVVFSGLSGESNPNLDVRPTVMYYNTLDATVAISKLKLLNISAGCVLFGATASPFEIKTDSDNFRWDDTQNNLETQNLSIRSNTTEGAIFFNNSATEKKLIAEPTKLKWLETSNILQVSDISITSDADTDGNIWFNSNSGLNKLVSAPTKLKWDQTNNTLECFKLSITSITSEGAIWFNSLASITEKSLESDVDNLKYNDSTNILEVRDLKVLSSTTAGAILFNNAVTPNKLIDDHAKFKWDAGNDILEAENLKINTIVTPGAIPFVPATAPYKLKSDPTNLKWDDSANILTVKEIKLVASETAPATNTTLVTREYVQGNTWLSTTIHVDNSTVKVVSNKISGGYTGGSKITIAGNSIAVEASFVSEVSGLSTRLGTAETTINGHSVTIASHTTTLGLHSGALVGLGILGAFSIAVGATGTIISGTAVGSLAESVGFIWNILDHYKMFNRTNTVGEDDEIIIGEIPGSFRATGTSNFTRTGNIIYDGSFSGVIKDYDYETYTELNVTNDTHPLRIGGGVEIGLTQEDDSAGLITLTRTGANLYVDGGIRQGDVSSTIANVKNFFSGTTEFGDYIKTTLGVITGDDSNVLPSILNDSTVQIYSTFNQDTTYGAQLAIIDNSVIGGNLGGLAGSIVFAGPAYTASGPQVHETAVRLRANHRSAGKGGIFEIQTADSADGILDTAFKIDENQNTFIGYSTAVKVATDGILTVNNTQEASSTSTGCTRLLGGLGVLKNVHIGGNLIVGGTISFGSLAFTTLTSTSTTILASTSGTTTIGSTNAAVFSAAGRLDINNTDVSSSITTGAFVCDGGVGIAKELYVGGYTQINSTGRLKLNSTLNAHTSRVDYTNAAFGCEGGAAINGKIFCGGLNNRLDTELSSFSGTTTIGSSTAAVFSAAGKLTINEATQSINTTTGGIVCAGGIGITKNLNVGGNFEVTGTTTTGSLTCTTISASSTTIIASSSGTTTIGSTTAAIFSAAGKLDINNTDESSSISSGAIICDGGIGVAKNVYVGGNLVVAGAISYGSLAHTTLTSTSTTILASTSGTTTIGSTTPLVISAAGNLTIAPTTGYSFRHGTVFSGQAAYRSIDSSQSMISGAYSLTASNHAAQLVLNDNSRSDGGGVCGALAFAGPAHSFGSPQNQVQCRITSSSKVGSWGGNVFIETLEGFTGELRTAFSCNDAQQCTAANQLTVGSSLIVGTTSSFAGAVNITDATVSSGFTTGALKVTGGVGVQGAVNVGGSMSSAGQLQVTDTTASSSKFTGALKVTGGIGLQGKINGSDAQFDSTMVVGPNTTSTANLEICNLANANSDSNFRLVATKGATTNATDDIMVRLGMHYNNAGTITPISFIRFHRSSGTDGYMSFSTNNNNQRMMISNSGVITLGSTTAATISAAGKLDINNTDESSSISTGAIVCDGGVGIAKSVNIGGTFLAKSDGYLTIGVSITTGTTYSWSTQVRKLRVIRTNLSAPATDTLPTAAEFYSNNGSSIIESSLDILIMNNTSHILTIAAGTGGTAYLANSTGNNIVAGCARLITIYIESSTTYDYFFHS